MDIYFLRHAIAMPRGIVEFPNDDRPLTEEGIQKMKKGARGILTLVPRVDVICSSPLIRALDTAKIAAEALDHAPPIRQYPELLPDAAFPEFVSMMKEHAGAESVMVVGHEPHLGRTVSTLLGAGRVMIDFKKGGLCRITVEGAPGSGSGTLICHLSPKQLRLLA